VRRLSTFFLVLAAAVGIAAAQTAGPKIGVFDPNRMLQETNEGKRVSEQITKYRDTKQAELDKKRQDIVDLQNQLQTQGLSLSAEKRADLEKQIQKRSLELNSAVEAAQREDQLETSEALTKFQGQIMSVLEQFARDEGFDIVLEKSLVAYSGPQVDVTSMLVERFNAVVTKPAPAASKGE
jgi:outer membrane protein